MNELRQVDIITVMTDSANQTLLGASSIAETLIAQARDDQRAFRMTPTMKWDLSVECKPQTRTAIDEIKPWIVSPRAMSGAKDHGLCRTVTNAVSSS